MRRWVYAHEAVALAYILGVSVLVGVQARWIKVWPVYLFCHALAFIVVALVAVGYRIFGGRFWRFLKYWSAAILVGGSFREIHYVCPQVAPYHDGVNDRLLAGLDAKFFGNVSVFVRSFAWPPLTDVMMVCYWGYLILPFVLGASLYLRGEYAKLRHGLTVLFLAFFLCYTGYWIVPARGPLSYDVAPSGFLIGDALRRGMEELEWDMPDAFPSGHVLVTLVILLVAWRYCRNLFWVFLPLSIGLVASTIYMRYHYVVDVLASFALVGPVWWLGTLLFRWWDRGLERDAAASVNQAFSRRQAAAEDPEAFRP